MHVNVLEILRREAPLDDKKRVKSCVTQSEAKSLVDIKVGVLEILRREAPLDDNKTKKTQTK